jgi:hypothetical protein
MSRKPSTRLSADKYLEALQDAGKLKIVDSHQSTVVGSCCSVCNIDGYTQRALVQVDDKFLHISLPIQYPGAREDEEYDPRKPLLDYADVHALEKYDRLQKIVDSVNSTS